MPTRLGLGPVFAFESLLNTRRWQVYAGRSTFVLFLLLGMVCIWISEEKSDLKHMAEVGQGFFYALTGIQVTLVLLAAPAAAAGSMGMDRARGTLLHMLVTDLSDAEIVLGTLAARLAPIYAIIVCGVPVMALAALLGGIDFGALAGAFVVSMALAVLGCVLALTLSVWVTKTHEVLMAVYMAVGAWLLIPPIWESASGGRIAKPPAWIWKTNPYVVVFEPYNDPAFAGAVEYAGFLSAVLALSAALLILSIARLRRVVVAQTGRPEQGSRRRLPDLKRFFPSWPSPTLDGNPVLWREWHRSRPSRLSRWLWVLLLIVTWSFTAWGTYRAITEGVSLYGENSLESGVNLQLFFGFLMLAAMAPTALAEERVRGSLDVLMVSPISTRAIVIAKWWGVYRTVLALLPLPLYTAVFLAAASPGLPVIPTGVKFPEPMMALTVWDRILAVTVCAADFLASGGVIVGLGLVVAIWVRRLGRAIALSVIFYLLIGIGWVILVEMSFSLFPSLFHLDYRWFQDNRWLMFCVVSLSPIAGPLTPIQTISNWYMSSARPRVWSGLIAVLLTKLIVAWLLLRLSIKTFDRRMGRVPEPRGPARGAGPFDAEGKYSPSARSSNV